MFPNIILKAALCCFSFLCIYNRNSEQPFQQPNAFAILIAVPEVNSSVLRTKYHLPDTTEFAKLPGTITDVQKIYNILRSEGFRDENIIRIGIKAGEKVTREDIIAGLTSIIQKKIAPNDLLVFYYSGHGSQLPDKNGDEEEDHLDEVLVTYNSYLLDDQLNKFYRDHFSQTRNVMLIDACHAGSMHSIFQKSLTQNVAHQPRSTECDLIPITYTDENLNMIYMGASRDKNEGWDTGKGGYFTSALQSMYHPIYWKGLTPSALACKVAGKMKDLRDPGNGLIQYTEAGKLSKEFINSYLFKINSK